MGQLALNQLLVTMDGIDNPPFWRRFWTNRINTWLDASYIVPRRLGKHSLRLPPPRADREPDLLHRGDERPARGARPGTPPAGPHGTPRLVPHADEEGPRGHLRACTSARSRTDPELDGPKARDEMARITSGYSPAMIEQVCSMALTHAHHDGREQFTREDIVEAMTTVESGTAVGVEYVPEETRAVAIHEAGHAVASHVFLKGNESTASRSECAEDRSAITKRWRKRSASASGAARRWETSSGHWARWLPSTSSTARTSNGVGGDLQHATGPRRMDGRACQAWGQTHLL